MATTTAAARHRAAAAIELTAAAALGCHRAAWALEVIGNRARVGRAAYDDTAALAQARRLEQDGHAAHTVVGMVARQLAPTPAAAATIARRLRDKRKKYGG